jgi:hypothetical protein
MEYCRLPGCQALLIGQMTVYDGRESDEGGARQYLDPKNGDGDGETAVLLRFPTGLMSGSVVYAAVFQGFLTTSGKLWWRVRGRLPPNSQSDSLPAPPHIHVRGPPKARGGLARARPSPICHWNWMFIRLSQGYPSLGAKLSACGLYDAVEVLTSAG